MSKVERTGGRPADAAGAGGRGGPRKVEGGADFAGAVEAAAAAGAAKEAADLDDLVARIDEAARRLAERRTLPELTAFRDLVKAFLERVVGTAYKVAEVPSARFAQNQKVFIVARKIDAALEDLSSHVLSGHATAVSILARSDEIRGLLLDLRS
jgi:uncharacterized protein YaaR (DUF327 family)